MATTTSVSSTASASIQSQVQQLMANDRVPLTNLQNEQTSLQSEVTEYQSLASRLSGLLTLSNGLVGTGPTAGLQHLTVEGNDSSVLDVTAGTGAVAGDLTVDVQQLATTHTLMSTAVSSSATPTAQPGGAAGGTASFKITAGGKTTTVSANLPANATWGQILSSLSDSINSTQGGVTASVLSVGNGQERLMLRAAASGTAGEVTSIQDVTGGWMGALGLTGLDKTGQLSATTQKAQDALLTINGAQVTASSNTIANPLPGVTLTLKAAGQGAETISLAQDSDATIKQIQDFITAYNAAVDEVRTDTQAADQNGQNRGMFAGDPTMDQLRTSLRNAVTASVDASNGSGYLSIADLGITTDQNGHLTLSDTTALQAALAANPNQVMTFLGGSNGVAQRLSSVLDAYSRTGGIVTQETNAVQTRITSISDEITTMNKNLAQRQDLLTQQLASAQATITALASQQQYITAILNMDYNSTATTTTTA